MGFNKAQQCFKWFQSGSNELRWKNQMNSHDFTYSKWVQMGSNGFKGVQMGLATWFSKIKICRCQIRMTQSLRNNWNHSVIFLTYHFAILCWTLMLLLSEFQPVALIRFWMPCIFRQYPKITPPLTSWHSWGSPLVCHWLCLVKSCCGVNGFSVP